ncbi:DUF2971 domain-containing protein [Luteolibacter arcticus]|uniref:DUF2971 domain-containing protein n=1 Tax=Luteolibacter arcticus TaxID=1581411 RepID=A0ABT3GSA0_9BACT|nr:DUF2971 domain-containing protein [Luteolibacter arcticus]MCW1926343.1 DUF2971 domain-containing protein [Luteolibacter arcticus]
MRLFRYFDSVGALRTLEDKRLRVGRIHALNDPFECLPGLVGIRPEGEAIADYIMRKFVGVLSESAGVICFSDNARESVLWSHYADHHRGIVLEFEVTDDPSKCIKMEYSDERLSVDYASFYGEGGREYFDPIFKKLSSRKSTGWAYEKEYRLYQSLAECKIGGGFYFCPIPPFCVRRVIIGWRSKVETSYVERVLSHNGWSHCVVTRAKVSPESFLIDYDTTEREVSSDAEKLGDD